MITPLVITVLQVIAVILHALWFLVIAHVIVSWLVSFQVLNLRQPLVSQMWYLLNRLTDPLYKPIRRFIPNIGGLDLTPMVLLLVIFTVSRLLANYYHALIY